MEKLIKVIYFNSNDFALGLLTELDINKDQLVALEIYNDGTRKWVVVRDGMVDYILSGKANGGSS